jgi:uncharacterized protein YggL (DUF469 family)
MKHFTINLSVSVPDDNTTLDSFSDKIMEVIDNNNWTAGGGFAMVDEEGEPIDSDRHEIP